MRKYILFIFFCVAIGVDVISKFLAEKYLTFEGQISVFSDFITLKLAHNNGIAFSLPVEGLTLQIVTVVIIGLIIYQYFQLEYEKRSYQIDIAYTLILAGAFSHAYERIFVGHVVDFIAVKYFAILNFADIFISTGIFLLLLFYVRIKYNRKYGT